MSTEENKQLVLRWKEELWGRRNLNVVDALCGPDYVGRIGGVPGPVRGREVSERFGLPSAVAKLPVEGEASPQASERLLVPPLPGVDEAEVAEGVSLARSVSAGRRSAAPAAVGWHALAGPAVHEPAISYSVPAGAGGLGQQRREPLDPSVDGHVVDLNPSFNQQLLNVAVRQPEAQAPADREDDDVWWEAEAREGRPCGGSGTEAMRSHTGSLAART